MAAKTVAHPSVADREAKGADARIATPPQSHAGWVPPSDRFDPVDLLEEQNVTREQDLVPGPARPDDGVALHLLPRRSEDHGRRPGRYPERRAGRAALR